MRIDEYLVSVIIPVYNVERYLSQCLESVIQQTFQNLEIIVINDGSTDRSGEICEKYAKKDSRICVYHIDNLGLAFVRNLGILKAKGSYLFFVDSDDWIEPNTIEVLLEAAIQTGANIVTAKTCVEYIGVSVPSSCNGETTIIRRQDILHSFIKGTLDDIVWNKFFHSTCFSKIRFLDGHNYEDLSFTWRLMKELAENDGKVTVLQIILFHHRMRSSSISYTRSLNNIIDCWKAYLDKYEGLSEYRDKLLGGCFKAIGRMWLYYTDLSREEKRAASNVIEEMQCFSRTHYQQVLKGHYPYSIKCLCILTQLKVPCLFWICSYAGKLREIIIKINKQPYV